MNECSSERQFIHHPPNSKKETCHHITYTTQFYILCFISCHIDSWSSSCSLCDGNVSNSAQEKEMDRKTESLYYYYYYCVWKIILYGQRPTKSRGQCCWWWWWSMDGFTYFPLVLFSFLLSTGQKEKHKLCVHSFSFFFSFSLLLLLPYVQQQEQ